MRAHANLLDAKEAARISRRNFWTNPRVILLAILATIFIGAIASNQGGWSTGVSGNAPAATSGPQLALLSASCARSSQSYVRCNGAVRNISGESLREVEMVILWKDDAGVTQRSDNTLIDYDPILAGQESPWHIIGTYNPALTKWSIAAQEFFGGSIPMRDDR